MSVISSRTSILKKYVSNNRDNKKRESMNGNQNRVRFDLLQHTNLQKILTDTLETKDVKSFESYLRNVRDPEIAEKDFFRVIAECRQCIDLLKPEFIVLVEALMALDWLQREPNTILEYQKFILDLVSAHSRYTQIVIERLIGHWVPRNTDENKWQLGTPFAEEKASLEYVHETINVLIDVIPMCQEMLLQTIDRLFPYYTKASYIIAGYVSNILWFMDYRSGFQEDLFQLLVKKFVIIDVMAPRSEIENAEYEDNDDEDDNDGFDDIFKMDAPNGEIKNYRDDEMRNQKAETLDICMEKLFAYIESEYTKTKRNNTMYKLLIRNFENVILPTHKSHHVQFLMFYFCSFKLKITKEFLEYCWQKISNPSIAPTVRQSAVSYMTSLLARAKFMPIGIIQEKLHDFCTWIHDYIQRCDVSTNTNILRAHLVFYSVCQSVFYIISFRCRDLTNSPKNLLFLNSLQLSTIVNCHLNPLRVCRPEVATAFAGITRTYQLTYCHTILERNARRKLALVYTNETAMPEDCLDTNYPFDPYILKKSGKRIEPIYLQYQGNEADDCEINNDVKTSQSLNKEIEINDVSDENQHQQLRRKRIESSSINGCDDIDDFIVDKRQKITELSMSFERDLQFNNTF